MVWLEIGYRQEGVDIDRKSKKGPHYEGAHMPGSVRHWDLILKTIRAVFGEGSNWKILSTHWVPSVCQVENVEDSDFGLPKITV